MIAVPRVSSSSGVGGAVPHVRPITQPAPRALLAGGGGLQHMASVRAGLPMSAPVIGIKRSRTEALGDALPDEEDEEEDDDFDDDDDEEEDDDDEEDDSIIASSDSEEEQTAAPKLTVKAAEALAREEALRYLGPAPLATSTAAGGRGGLRNRGAIKNPNHNDPMLEAMRKQFERDEKEELIKELKKWKITLGALAEQRGVVFPSLRASMSLSDIREQHTRVRMALDLESTDDDDSEEEDDDDDDDDDDDYEEASMSTSSDEDEDDDDDEEDDDEDDDEDEDEDDDEKK